MKTPVIHVRKKDRTYGWLTLDFREDEEIEAVVVIPTYGPNHNAGLDCWCCPAEEDGAIVHNGVQ